MAFFSSKARISIEGIMPERALLRLKRAKIDVYNVKKIQKNQILLSVKAKDCEKVFAFYPNVCYNISKTSPYKVKKIALTGVKRYVEWGKNRVGLLLGGLLYCILTLFFNSFIFGVKFVGTDIYAREGYIALEENGIKPFAPYKKGSEDMICAQLLTLDGVEYCSVQKKGLYAYVEIRLSPFAKDVIEKESMKAKHSGTLLSLTVLKGTPLKKTGEAVAEGETLVENAFYTQDGGQVCVEPIARAVISCVFEADIQAETQEKAFAESYLQLCLSEKDVITQKEITQLEDETNSFHVKIEYTVIETINL